MYYKIITNLLQNWLGSYLFTLYFHLKLYKNTNIANYVYYGKTRFFKTPNTKFQKLILNSYICDSNITTTGIWTIRKLVNILDKLGKRLLQRPR